MDKKLKVLSALDFEKPIYYHDLFKMSGIEREEDFVKIIDLLGKDHYIDMDNKPNITLYRLSSLEEYKSDKLRQNIGLYIGIATGIIALATLIATLFKP